MKILAIALFSLFLSSTGLGGTDSLREKIERLKAPEVAWRKIPWKSCLLDGLREARKTGKPMMLWVFIDRPFDDARC